MKSARLWALCVENEGVSLLVEKKGFDRCNRLGVYGEQVEGVEEGDLKKLVGGEQVERGQVVHTIEHGGG
ncbi:MAG: hypothetical protein ACYTBJ_19710 [Planctomycetota bacterium]